MYKLNHFIPRSILNQWVSSGRSYGKKYDGVWCYLIQEDRVIYANSKGQKAFSFAISEDLYVPIIRGIRKVEFEGNWLSGLESAFANFLKQLREIDPVLSFDSLYDITKILMAFHTFKYRSKYDLNKILSFLIQNPERLSDISFSLDAKVAAIENIVHATTETYLKNQMVKLFITKCENEEVIFGDRPYVQLNQDSGLILFPGNPSTILGMQRHGIKNSFPIIYRVTKDESNSLIPFNQLIAENAHYWIIAFKKETLEKYIRFCDRSGRKKGSVIFEPIFKLPYGWKL